ncbi:helix-turn-helix domain-containing protein [Streptomyces sp. KM273126]|uniref:helix-turn-helix transcriptional regulator n=1 Tax=Streptomyces sp. KM273126 TaxID=2545247 RepID=UPI001040AE7D|nr:helix-turn-helix transcriptional regulator [Streptomyces sp. KM273126]MBA2808211.1 helix-turn-helix domain-containing protein [Streptomyces sp. KM273126]
MDAPSQLGDFLKSRRAALRPEDVGITPNLTRRRVTGLRREELATLAGVSITHYTRLEQGRATGASDGVLEAIARTLRLTDDETAHLKDLARPTTASSRRAALRVEHAGASARQLLAAMTDVPALALDRRNDVLAWNQLGHALLAGHLAPNGPDMPAGRPNLTRMLFLDEQYRALYTNWNEEAQLAVASLRLIAGRHPDDRSLAELIGQLTMNCDEFASQWARHPVRTCTSGVKRLRHPLVGAMDLSFENLVIPGTSGQRLIAYTAEPGSPSEAALRLLGSATAPAAGEHVTADSTPPLRCPVVGEPATDELPSAAVGPTLTR